MDSKFNYNLIQSIIFIALIELMQLKLLNSGLNC